MEESNTQKSHVEKGYSLSYILYVINWPIGIVVRVFANGLEDKDSIPKIQKMVLDNYLLNTQHYKVKIKDKWSNPEKGVVPSSTPQCSCYWKGSLWFALDYGRPIYLYHKED